MKLTIAFTDEHARRLEACLQRKYKSKAKLPKLARIAICNEAAAQAKIDLAELGVKI